LLPGYAWLMSDSSRSRGGAPGALRALRAIGSNPITVWGAFVAVHLWLGLLNLYAPGLPLGDVTIVYKFWSEQALSAGFLVGIDSVWVYPILALVPMLGAAALGPTFYASTWLTMVMLLNAVAFGVLTGWGRSRDRTGVAWWWVLFLLLLGPIALGRIDSITIPFAIVGVLLLASRPRAAAVLLTIGTWIKVWPAALLAAVVVASKQRWRVVVASIAASVAIVVVPLVLGRGSNVLSFITAQTGRGLQIEAPVSSIWLWRAIGGMPDSFIYYDNQILTYQVTGAGADIASAVMTPLLGLVAIGLCLLGAFALHNRAASSDVLPPLALALVTALIAFNKVGSPQFITWLAVPVILGLTMRVPGHVWSFRVPAVLVGVIAALTQVVYPYLYGWLLGLHPALLAVLTIRNLLLFVLLGWAVAQLIRVARAAIPLEQAGRDDDVGTAPWPINRGRKQAIPAGKPTP
jgi:hypothetical protein